MPQAPDKLVPKRHRDLVEMRRSAVWVRRAVSAGS